MNISSPGGLFLPLSTLPMVDSVASHIRDPQEAWDTHVCPCLLGSFFCCPRSSYVLSACPLPYLAQIGFTNFCPWDWSWGCGTLRPECKNKSTLTSRRFLWNCCVEPLPLVSMTTSFWLHGCLRPGFPTNWFFCLCNVSCGLTRTKV